MKSKVLMFLGLVLLLAACKANYPVAQQSGKEDMAFLLFVSPGEYGGKNVQVIVDGFEPFEARVVKSVKSNRRGTQYGIATGRRKLKVVYHRKTIYQKEIFVSSQDVKKIVLP